MASDQTITHSGHRQDRRPTILVVDDVDMMREELIETLSDAGYETEGSPSAEVALLRLEKFVPDLVLTDYKLGAMSGVELVAEVKAISPATEIIVMTAFSTISLAVEAVRRGAFDFLEKPFVPERLLIAVRRAFEHQHLLLRNDRLALRLRHQDGLEEMVGHSEPMRRVYDAIEAVAFTDSTVLVEGESGTGKELVASAIHARSRRASEPLLRINCAAMPEGLLESEMFGHERGAFTGASCRKIGHFERADAGTLLLDEITEMAPRLQAKLLRVLQSGEFQRVGGAVTLRSDVRVLAATNRVPRQAVEEGLLREDLYYRLNVFSIRVPPLRDRGGDLSLLVQHFLVQLADRLSCERPLLSPAAMRVLTNHAWPGNVRELANALNRAVVLVRGGSILPEHLPEDIRPVSDLRRGPGPQDGPGPSFGGTERPLLPVPMSLRDLEGEAIAQTLAYTNGNKAAAARHLGIGRDKLYQRIRELGLA